MASESKKNYVNIHLKVNEEYFDYTVAYLANYKIEGIEEKNDELVVCFLEENWQKEFINEIAEIIKSIDDNSEIIDIVTVADKNWNEEWEKNLPPIIVSENLAIVPSWKLDEVDSEMKIIIDPKMSFGTGHHATTRLVCKLMENLIVPGSFWVDAGTGTGVQAILAAKKGASSVFAFDNDIWSLENAIENCELNDVVSKIQIEQADINTIQIPECNGISANLYTHLLLSSLPKFYNSLKNSNGILLISGVLKYDESIIKTAAEKIGFKHEITLYEDEWIAAKFRA